MSLFIKKAKYKNGKVYCSIVDGYRINGKVKQTVVRNYGYYSDLKSKHNNVDSFLNNELEILKKEFETKVTITRDLREKTHLKMILLILDIPILNIFFIVWALLIY